MMGTIFIQPTTMEKPRCTLTRIQETCAYRFPPGPYGRSRITFAYFDFTSQQVPDEHVLSIPNTIHKNIGGPPKRTRNKMVK